MRADSDAITETGTVHAQPPGLSAAQRRAVPQLRAGGWAGLLVTSSTGAVRAVALPTRGGDAGNVGGSARLQLVDGRLYAEVYGIVWLVDARAVHAPQQFGLWAFTPGARLLVRSHRIADEVLGCNS